MQLAVDFGRMTLIDTPRGSRASRDASDGQYLTMIGRPADAQPYFEKAHGLDPLFSESYRGEGYSCFMAHKYDEAIIQYRKALELEPDAITYFGLVLARSENGVPVQPLLRPRGQRN